MAKLHCKYGAINSGKNDTLIKTAYNYTERQHDGYVEAEAKSLAT